MSGEQRLNRVYPALTAKERGLLILQAYKSREKPDRLIYDTTPDGQGRDFNHRIRLMNAANVELSTVLFVLREQIAKLDMKHAWLMTLRWWADDTASLRMLVGLNTKEPITASEHAKRQAVARDELLPLGECVQIIMDDHPWTDADYETDKDGERDVSAKAWNRVERATRQQLKQLIADGALPSRRRGRLVLIPADAFYDWRGEPTPVYPDDAWEFDIRPDEQAEEVQQDLKVLAAVRRLFDRAPKPLPTPADLAAPIRRPVAEGGLGTELEHALVVSISDLLRQHWCEVRAIDVCIAEVAAQWFDGEDVLRSDTRAILDGCLTACQKLRDDMAEYADIALAEPSEGDVAQVRLLLEKLVED
jgi:hypothetical protein